MSEWSEQKRHWRVAKVTGGNPNIPGVPESILARWDRAFDQPLEPILSSTPRLVNAYKLGADPEFVMEYRDARIDAMQLGLQTGYAFGADMNGRLVEIRPAPSRSALEVIASTMVTLQWLGLMHQAALAYTWKAGAFVQKDGLGGHVHFGRKRNNRDTKAWAESRPGRHDMPRLIGDPQPKRASIPPYISALDKLTETLLALGVYPKEQNDRRRAGDQHGQHYGLPGDVRMQAHGFEYRVFPSWLDSPWAAYLTLVLAKLTIYDPELIKDKVSIQDLLAFYKGLDDDARLAYFLLLKLGYPKYQGGDFKGRWGVPATSTQTPLSPPMEIKPTWEDIKTVYYLLLGQPCSFVLTPSWSWKVPLGYARLLGLMDTTGKMGLGEILWDTIYHTDHPLTINHGGETGPVFTSFRTPSILFGQDIVYQRRMDKIISLPLQLRDGAGVKLARKILYSGYFPLWKLSEVKPSSFTEWQSKQHLGAERKSESKIIYRS